MRPRPITGCLARPSLYLILILCSPWLRRGDSIFVFSSSNPKLVFEFGHIQDCSLPNWTVSPGYSVVSSSAKPSISVDSATLLRVLSWSSVFSPRRSSLDSFGASRCRDLVYASCSLGLSLVDVSLDLENAVILHFSLSDPVFIAVFSLLFICNSFLKAVVGPCFVLCVDEAGTHCPCVRRLIAV
ncbi:hypothetical protein Nepgr_015829 [Nepenthes gracilis]|uniref:Secreted protein n=1 Tax=Nepenthes gracilis TaxID=150966 RepID=A0AAD3SMF7_NEPGR|nr:hypothetical protein Nepgr_015829 [Nepenthes gracilis]